MAMNPQQPSSCDRFIQHNIIRPDKPPVTRYVEADPKDVAIIHGMRIWVADPEGGYASAGAVEVFLFVEELLGGCCMEGVCVWGEGSGGLFGF